MEKKISLKNGVILRCTWSYEWMYSRSVSSEKAFNEQVIVLTDTLNGE